MVINEPSTKTFFINIARFFFNLTRISTLKSVRFLWLNHSNVLFNKSLKNREDIFP